MTDETPDDASKIEEELAELVADARDAAPRTERPAASRPAGSEALEAERDDLRQLAQRVQADFENYRKRVMRDQVDVVQRATEGLVEQLLPVLDAFELAVRTLDTTDESVRKGVELVYAQLVGVLERAGLERVDTDGQPFDPNVHEAVMHEEGDGEPVVTETMRTGYRFKDKVLRPAMVRVGPAS